jgi:hypothetical protein
VHQLVFRILKIFQSRHLLIGGRLRPRHGEVALLLGLLQGC